MRDGSTGYRRDIDGLRTIAVLPVVFFHAGWSALSGGYVGVDVFFVISGFLITGIIAREVDEGRFSIVAFYERRIRRILPALFAVIVFVLAASAVLYFPKDFASVGRSIVATLLFVSNVNFWLESDYFGASAHTKPMLHTWSLAVEEQFYIVFPLLLVFVARVLPRWRAAVLWAIFAGSLLFCVWQTRAYPSAAFYLPVSRTWELAAGALLAVGAVPAIRHRRAREIVAIAGLAAIAWAVFAFTGRTRFPGAAALFPVLGAAALIHCAPGTLVGRLLSIKPMVAVGLISYSLYLWHWPLIVFTDYARDRGLSGAWAVAVVAAAFLMAALSWRFVEQPFRSRQRIPRPRLFRQAATGAAALAAISAVVMAGGGWPGRFRPDVLRLAEATEDVSPLRTRCHVNSIRAIARERCSIGANVAPDTLVWGDSHGVEIAYALGEIARSRGRALMQATGSSCTPVVGLDVTAMCNRFNLAVMRLIEARRAIRTVVLVGYWADTANSRRRGLSDALIATVQRLRASGRRVVLLDAIPPQETDVPRLLAHLAQQGRLAEQHGRARSEIVAKTLYVRPAFDQLRASGVPIVDPKDALCRGDACDIYRDGRALYFDRHHLSLAGARIVAQQAAPTVFVSAPR
ncbi:acyltransferase family protein [Sphingomonas sp.]|uniref:acyltransferase family protein n=1 Tax=Sphingomonas sp. TaxID=28214 RepID=UPI002EDB08D1